MKAPILAALLASHLLCIRARYRARRGSSVEPAGLRSGGDQLEAILEAAAAVWEDIIEDPGTITITWGWDSLAIGLGEGEDDVLLGALGGRGVLRQQCGDLVVL